VNLLVIFQRRSSHFSRNAILILSICGDIFIVYSQESLFHEDDYNRSCADFNNNETNLGGKTKRSRDSARIILLHTGKVDKLYLYMQQDENVSKSIIFEDNPTNAARGESFFHICEPNSYQL
jgi:hypothetical protein